MEFVDGVVDAGTNGDWMDCVATADDNPPADALAYGFLARPPFVGTGLIGVCDGAVTEVVTLDDTSITLHALPDTLGGSSLLLVQVAERADTLTGGPFLVSSTGLGLFRTLAYGFIGQQGWSWLLSSSLPSRKQ